MKTLKQLTKHTPMGCDIHCYVEYKSAAHSHWRPFGGRINPGRNYTMFGFMAGVRCGDLPHFTPRGAASDMAYKAADDNRLYISKDSSDSEGNCSPESAERWVNSGIAEYTDDSKKFVTHPDWHSHSWLSPSEFEQCLEQCLEYYAANSLPSDICEYRALLAALQSFENQGFDARLVFWFDN